MHYILEQERLFFELTKVIMTEDKARTSEIDLEGLSRTTKMAYDFMCKLLSMASEEKLLHLYL